MNVEVSLCQDCIRKIAKAAAEMTVEGCSQFVLCSDCRTNLEAKVVAAVEQRPLGECPECGGKLDESGTCRNRHCQAAVQPFLVQSSDRTTEGRFV